MHSSIQVLCSINATLSKIDNIFNNLAMCFSLVDDYLAGCSHSNETAIQYTVIRIQAIVTYT
jgi:geranylgeranyl pyrophosphate synthase